ncbi:hypothetical protein [Actinophytocola xinjiangensis]|nr:hypothetical protein [Actinophytocola xinjiangensis]
MNTVTLWTVGKVFPRLHVADSAPPAFVAAMRSVREAEPVRG